jgi:hypothetical protein
VPRKRRTAGEASLFLAKYESLNRDLPKATRRQLAAFVLEPHVGKAALEELFDRPLGQTLDRHRAWLWYNAIRLSGMEDRWDEFTKRKNDTGCMRCSLLWLRGESSKEEWALLSKRMGVPLFRDDRSVLNPYRWACDGESEHKPALFLWTRGGAWDRRVGFTKILLLGKHLDRDPDYNQITRLLTQQDLRTVELECKNLFDPDKMLAPQAIVGATEYVRRRIPSILGHKSRGGSYKVASWFFQGPVPHPRGGYIYWTSEANYSMKHSDGMILDWLPPKPPA